jgi:hypothetical protein
MLRPLKLLIFISVSVLFTTVAIAQETQSDQQSLLPEIDPQDIEIRSQFQARFPGLRRQPILGFNPRPRVFQMDPNRTPFIEDEETVAANLPIGSLARPEPPSYQPLGYADPENGFARIGIGSFFTPEADIYAIARLGQRNWVSGNVSHSSTNGHIDGLTSSSRNLNVNLNGFSAISDRTKLSTRARVISNFNHFPGLVTENGEPTNVRSRTEVFGFSGGLDLKVARTTLSGVEFSIDGYANQFDLSSELQDVTGTAGEWGVKNKLEYSRLGGNIQEVHRLRLTNSTGGIELIDSGMQTWSVTNLSAHYERLFNYQTEIEAELGIAGVTDATEDFSFYVTPRVSVSHTLFSGLDIRLNASGKPSHQTLGRVQAENNFMDLTTPLQHQFEWKASGEVEMEPFFGTKFIGGASYHNVKNYLFYTRNSNPVPGTNLVEGYYRPNFDRANIFRVYGAFSQDLTPNVLWIRADGYWQIPRISGNQKIPFVENYAIKGSVSYRPFGQVILEGWTEYIGGREDSFGDNLSSFILLGSRFEISLTENLGVYGKLINLMSEEYELWQGYPERGFQGFVGVTYLF